jgi:hypothetical protein
MQDRGGSAASSAELRAFTASAVTAMKDVYAVGLIVQLLHTPLLQQWHTAASSSRQ